MTNELLSADFDLVISEVILAHKYMYGAGSVNDAYCRGRNASGLVYCVSGSADYFFAHKHFALHTGDVVFLPESAAYEVRCHEDFHHITVNFRLLPGESQRLINNMYSQYASQIVAVDSLQTEGILQNIVDLWSNKPAGFRIQVKSLLYDLLYRYYSCLRKQNRSEEYIRLRPAKKILDLQYSECISVSELAAACGFSQTHFRRLFIKEFGCSPLEYRLSKQLSRAQDLLLAGELSISEIANATGFTDANYFSRVFKAHLGVSPSEFISIHSAL